MGLDEEQQKVLTDLKRKRGVIKAALTRVQTFISKFDPLQQAISLIGFRQEELPQINRKFDDIQTQIELITVDDIEGAEAEREKFETDYFAVRSQIQEIMDHEKAMNTTVHNTSNGTSINLNRTQLAAIPLPKFSGDIQDWASFYDIFKAMVHNEDGYSAAQKFYYLRSCLEGAALDLVRSTPVCDGNYEVVIQMLKQRYDNRSLVIQSHIRSILECPSMGVSSSGTLQKLYANVTTHVAALRALDQPVEYWDAWLVTIVTSRLDKDTAHGWLLRQRNTSLPKYSDLESFLASRCAALEGSEALSKGNGSAASSNFKKNAITEKRSLLVATEFQPCPFCTGAHKLFSCEKFKGLSVSDRFTFARKSALCFNCLSTRHMSNTCRSMYTCRECKQKHNTLLHMDKAKDSIKEKELSAKLVDKVEPASGVSSAASLLVGAGHGHVFLATATVYVQDKFGVQHECRLVLDSGSQLNFISRSLASLLSLPLKRASLPISGIGANQVHAASFGELKVRSRTTDYELDLECYVLPNIVADLAASPVPKEGWNIPDELSYKLADPGFYKQRTVDLLVGGGAFFDILGTERRALQASTVWLQESRFGWIVTGELGFTCLASVNFVQDPMEEDWKISLLEEDAKYGRLSKSNLRSSEEKEVFRHFQETAIRNPSGRFVLRLPIKQNVAKLGNSFTMATSRFINVERRLQRDPYLKAEYIKFMNDYLEMGHMQEVLNETSIPEDSFYMPHHAVVKSSSLTTKVRVVFDASAKSSSGMSLNDILKRGPTVQKDLFAILTRFRKHQYVITSDIEKMFRQIAVAEPDWDLQRILWRSDPSEVLRTYRLVTVTYGTTPASFMTTQCLIKLAEEASEHHPKAASVIMQDFYMDDLMTGCDTEEECCQLQQEVSSILNSAKLPLRKWCSNSQIVLKYISKEEQDPLFTLDIGDDDTVKSLGLCWKPWADEFRFNIIAVPEKKNLTKRVLLSQLNRIFDPLGFLAPILIKGKIFLRQLWQLKMDWDTSLPEELQERWRIYHAELEDLKNLSIPRKSMFSATRQVEIHGFSDASMDAYGACIYVRSLGNDNEWYSKLLCARTRVSPLKGVTIPRLELDGALLLAQLASKVAKSWKVAVQDFRFWTDSMVVLSWLNSDSSRLKTYIANRVIQILEVSAAAQWRHVKTNENPADSISRGIGAQELIRSRLWWNGPSWLSQAENQWKPNSVLPIPEGELPEQRPIKLVLSVVSPWNTIFSAFSSWRHLVRAVAWFIRFIKYIREKRSEKGPRYLRVSELRNAETTILKRVQYEEFPLDIAALEKGIEVPRCSKIKSLYPYLSDGLLLVGGRLQYADIPHQQKHPIVLPAKHVVTRLIFEERHREMLHCGPQSLLAEVRRRYWPLKGRVMARTVTTKCVRCIKAKPQFISPVMGQLPIHRVRCSRPFSITGVDFAGPIMIRSGIRRIVAKKAWISVFVCFATRAVHLEVVEDLTSSAFVAALRRFMSRRGCCTKIYSDNGTNFVGAQKELSVLINKSVPIVAREGIEWSFNPPSAPHFGGLWESAVKSAKNHLTRIMGQNKLTLGELNTLLCQIEACLNSRPMTPINSDPSELEALTPAHFLIGGAINLPEEVDLTQEPLGHVRRWKYVQFLAQTFWRRWHIEYLPQCQVRGKWTTRKDAIKVDDIVIIRGECSSPTSWKLGRVIELHPGRDGIVRVVTLRIASGIELKRPIVKLCILPTEVNQEIVGIDDSQRGEDV